MRQILLALIAALTITITAQAEPPKVDDPRFMFDPKDMVQVKEGITLVDLDGDGVDDFIVKSLRNNLSQHTSSVYSFHRKCKKNTKDHCYKNDWEIIGMYRDAKYNFEVNFNAGLFIYGYKSDIRLLKIKNNNSSIIVGIKRKVNTLSDAAHIEFYRYILRTSEDFRTEYIPPAFWIEDGVYISKGVYVDVGEAFLLELGLPDPDEEIHDEFIKTGGKPRPD